MKLLVLTDGNIQKKHVFRLVLDDQGIIHAHSDTHVQLS